MQRPESYRPLRYLCIAFLFGVLGGGIASGPFFMCSYNSWGLFVWTVASAATFGITLAMLMMRH